MGLLTFTVFPTSIRCIANKQNRAKEFFCSRKGPERVRGPHIHLFNRFCFHSRIYSGWGIRFTAGLRLVPGPRMSGGISVILRSAFTA